MTERAPAKVNLCLFVGPTRPHDGRHELVSVMQSVGLEDRLTLAPGGLGQREDRVVCAGVEGDNLALTALQAFRARTGWAGAPVTVTIDKRIPVAAGMAGGSADAAGTLRLAARAAGLDDDDLLREVAAGLGADVPAQVRPGRWLATGAGERLEPLADPPPGPGLLVLPSRHALSTPAVYREFDRLGLQRTQAELDALLHRVRTHGADLPLELCTNDLEPAALALCPPIQEALDAARRLGADHAMVCGSGPTVVGLFARHEAARAAATALAGRDPRPVAVAPIRHTGPR